MARSTAKRKRVRGAVDPLPSGALRVRVYAGEDPLTGKRHSLIEIIPPGPQAAAQAEAARVRLLSQVDERRNPRTNATVDQLLDLYLENLDVGRSRTEVPPLARSVGYLLAAGSGSAASAAG